MSFLHCLANFFSGLFLCNAIPHLAAGLRGESFPTPFAKPPGIGHSSPLVNMFWGSGNLVAGLSLLRAVPVKWGWNVGTLLMVAGFLSVGWHLAWHFGKVRMGAKQR